MCSREHGVKRRPGLGVGVWIECFHVAVVFDLCNSLNPPLIQTQPVIQTHIKFTFKFMYISLYIQVRFPSPVTMTPHRATLHINVFLRIFGTYQCLTVCITCQVNVASVKHLPCLYVRANFILMALQELLKVHSLVSRRSFSELRSYLHVFQWRRSLICLRTVVNWPSAVKVKDGEVGESKRKGPPFTSRPGETVAHAELLLWLRGRNGPANDAVEFNKYIIRNTILLYFLTTN